MHNGTRVRQGKGRSVVLAAAVAGAAVLVGATPAGAATISVAAGETALARNGRCSIREAVINANVDARTHLDCAAGSGEDLIDLPAGPYDLGPAKANDPADIDTGGLEDAFRGLRISSPVILRGRSPGRPVLDGAGLVRPLLVEAEGDLFLLDVSVTNGFADALDEGSGSGGAVLNRGSLAVVGSLLEGNRALLGGGGAIANHGELIVERTVFSGNRGGSFGEGGAIDNAETGTASISDSTFQRNLGGSGAAISNAGSLTLERSRLMDNLAGQLDVGGAIANGPTGNTWVADTTVAGNVAGSGGAAANAGRMTILRSSLTANVAQGSTRRAAGGAILNDGDLTLARSTMSDNIAWAGGAISNGQTGNLRVENGTVSGNLGESCDAICNQGTLVLTSTTIAGRAPEVTPHPTMGGIPMGLEVSALVLGSDPGVISNFGSARAVNTIIADYLELSCFGEALEPGTGNLSSDDSCGVAAGFSRAAALLGPLGANGGPTLTHLPLPTSPAIDAGDRGTCDAIVPNEDQRGGPRVVGPGCDVGAVEVTFGDGFPLLRRDVVALNIDPGLKNSLLLKVDASGAAYDRKASGAASNQLGAFINEVDAHRGAEIPALEADRLVLVASRLRGFLSH